MYKKILPIVLFFFSFSLAAQELTSKETTVKVEIVKNSAEEFQLTGTKEFRLNMLDLLTINALNFSFEKLVDSQNSYGVSAYLNGKFTEFPYAKFSVSPFYRFYFLNKEGYGARGRFVEVFSSFATGDGDSESDLLSGSSSDKSWTDVSLGVSVGKKWINKKGWTFEIYIGAGKYLFSEDSPSHVLRYGLTLGKRI